MARVTSEFLLSTVALKNLGLTTNACQRVVDSLDPCTHTHTEFEPTNHPTDLHVFSLCFLSSTWRQKWINVQTFGCIWDIPPPGNNHHISPTSNQQAPATGGRIAQRLTRQHYACTALSHASSLVSSLLSRMTFF